MISNVEGVFVGGFDDLTRTAAQSIRKALQVTGDELAPVLLGRGMQRTVKPLADALDFKTLEPVGTTVDELIKSNGSLLDEALDEGRRVFFVGRNQGGVFIPEELERLRKRGFEAVQRTTITNSEGVEVPVFEFVRME